MVPDVSLRFMRKNIAFAHFSTGTIHVTSLYVCLQNSSGGVANVFLQSSDVEEVVWVSHMKSTLVHNDVLKNVGEVKRTDSNEAVFTHTNIYIYIYTYIYILYIICVCISQTKTQLHTPPPGLLV